MSISQTSSGVVIFRDTSAGRFYLLLQYLKEQWNFAKGKIEQGETSKMAAIRETQEETGITKLEFIPGFEQKIHYDFTYEHTHINKTVIYYLAKTTTSKVELSDEHTGYDWLSFYDAFHTITHTNSKNVLRKAHDHLSRINL